MDGSDTLKQYLDGVVLRADIGLAIVKAYHDAGASPPENLVSRAVTVWRRFDDLGYKVSKDVQESGICLCEILAEQGTDADPLCQLLDIFTPDTPQHPPTFFEERVSLVSLWNALLIDTVNAMTQ